MTKNGILELEQRRFKAMCDGDADALGALLHDGLTYTHSSGAVDSKESYTRGVRDKLWDYQSIKASDAKVSLHGNAALVHCRLRIDVKVGGVPKIVESVALAVWLTTAAGECIAVHSTPAPKRGARRGGLVARIERSEIREGAAQMSQNAT